MKRSEALAYRAKIEKAASFQDDETALQSIELYPIWIPGITVQVGERYQDEGILYRCIQAHTTQADWKPSLTPALWAVVSVEEWPEWKQPIGASDAYNKGAKVSHNNKHWESLVDSNVWEPGAVGTESLWTEV